MVRRRNRESAPPVPVIRSGGLAQLNDTYDQSVKLFLEHLPGFRPLEELDPVMKRRLRLDEETKKFVPVETWSQVLQRAGVAMHDPRKREAMRLCWLQLRRIDDSFDVPPRNDIAVYLRRDGSWLLWLYRGADDDGSTMREQLYRVASPRQLPLPDGYLPHGDTPYECLTDGVVAMMHSVMQHALSKAIATQNDAAALRHRLQYASGY